MSEPARPPGTDLMQFAAVGLQLALTVALFTYLGYKLDEWLSTGPWLLITMAFVGVTGGMISVIRRVNSWSAAAKRRDGETPDEP